MAVPTDDMEGNTVQLWKGVLHGLMWQMVWERYAGIGSQGTVQASPWGLCFTLQEMRNVGKGCDSNLNCILKNNSGCSVMNGLE